MTAMDNSTTSSKSVLLVKMLREALLKLEDWSLESITTFQESPMVLDAHWGDAVGSTNDYRQSRPRRLLPR